MGLGARAQCAAPQRKRAALQAKQSCGRVEVENPIPLVQQDDSGCELVKHGVFGALDRTIAVKAKPERRAWRRSRCALMSLRRDVATL